MTDEQSSLIKAERARLSVTLVLFAISRDIDAMATGDQRFIAAADSVKKIEATLHMVDDAVLLKLASVDETSKGGLLALIAARLSEIGFALPLYEDARSFIAPIVATVDRILHDARRTCTDRAATLRLHRTVPAVYSPGAQTLRRLESSANSQNLIQAPFEQCGIGPDLFEAACRLGLEGLGTTGRLGPCKSSRITRRDAQPCSPSTPGAVLMVAALIHRRRKPKAVIFRQLNKSIRF